MGDVSAARTGAVEVLMGLTRTLTSVIRLEDALQAVSDAALELLPADHASIRVLDESATELLCGARSGAGLAHEPVTFRTGQGVVGWVVAEARTARVDDAAKDKRFAQSADQGFPIRSLLVVPLWSADRVVGALGVTAERPKAFGSDDEVMVTLLANCAGPPIERARLQRLAVTDPLTLTFNQRYLAPRLDEEIARAHRYDNPLCVLLLDLDKFKPVNDEHGHAVGDTVLRRFTDRVREVVRRSDALVRRGGDEFVLIMPHATQQQALHAGERIRSGLADAVMDIDEAIRVHQTVSIGVAAWHEGESAETLEARADRALYRAKAAGRNRVAVATATTDAPPAQSEPDDIVGRD